MAVNLDELPLPDELPAIPDGWRYESLGDLVEERGVSYGIVQPGSEASDGVPIVRVNNIRNGRIDTTDMLKVGADIEAKFQRSRLRGGEVLLTLVGTLGEVAIVPDNLRGWNVARAVGVIPVRKDPGSIWVSICLRSAFIQHCIRTWATTTVQATFNLRDLAKLPIPIPPTETREAIAAVLGALDDKIELNRRMNATLEAMARALFQSWFVDFDPVRAKLDGRQPAGMDADTAALFPEHLEDSPLGHIPHGWSLKTIDELAERVAMGPFGSDIKVSTFVPEGIPVISGQHLRGTLLDDSEFNFVTVGHADRLNRSNVQRGDVIFTHAGSIGQVAYIPEASRYERYIVSQRQFYMRCNRASVSPFYITSYFKTPEGQHRLLANTSSTGVPSISQPVTYLRQLKMVVPPPALLKVFDMTVGQIHLKMADNDKQSRTLATLRDTLLPKLLSGELSVAAVTSVSGE